MAQTIGKLTALGISRLKTPGLYSDGNGLYLQVTSANAKSWIFRFKQAGKSHAMGLGSLSALPLAEARRRAAECRAQRLEGLNPIAARKVAREKNAFETAKAIRFSEAARRYIAAHKAGWKSAKHAAQWEATLKSYAEPVIGKISVQEIDTALVLAILEPIWNAKPETASRLRGRIEAILDWAQARGLRQGENPARWRGHLAKLLPAASKVRRVKHHPALPYLRIPTFMTTLRKQEGVAARALEFTILTAARTAETIGMTWDEVDLKERTWTVPATRMKAGREHRVPLADQVLGILSTLDRASVSKCVFPGNRKDMGLSNMAMAMLLDRMGEKAITVHGFRSTFRDWAAETTNFPNEVVEMALAHTVSDKTEAAYRRGALFDKRRTLMTAWAEYCATPKPITDDSILPLRGKNAETRSAKENRT